MVNRDGVAQPVVRVPPFARRHPLSCKASRATPTLRGARGDDDGDDGDDGGGGNGTDARARAREGQNRCITPCRTLCRQQCVAACA